MHKPDIGTSGEVPGNYEGRSLPKVPGIVIRITEREIRVLLQQISRRICSGPVSSQDTVEVDMQSYLEMIHQEGIHIELSYQQSQESQQPVSLRKQKEP